LVDFAVQLCGAGFKIVVPGNASLRIQIFKVKAGGRQPLAVERNNDHAPILSRGAPKNSHGCCCVAA
jgi:hypothetical protein